MKEEQIQATIEEVAARHKSLWPPSPSDDAAREGNAAFIEALLHYWNQYPHLRFGQFLWYVLEAGRLNAIFASNAVLLDGAQSAVKTGFRVDKAGPK